MPSPHVTMRAIGFAIISYLLLFILFPTQIAALIETIATYFNPSYHLALHPTSLLLFTNLFIYIVLFCQYSLLFHTMLKADWSTLFTARPPFWRQFGLAIGYLAFTLLVGYGYLLFTHQPIQSVNQVRINHLLEHFFWPTLLFILVFGPFVEELLFRFSIFTLGKKWHFSPLFTISCSTILFAFVHILPNGAIWMMAPYLSLGFGLAVLYHYTHNFWLCFSLHSLNNIISILFFLLTT